MPLITIPKKIEGMNKSERYILNKLKHLYMSEQPISFLYLEPQIRNLTPDFILIDPARGVMIIEVKAWSLDYFDTINKKSIKTSTGQTLENPSAKARRYFNILQGIFRFSDGLIDEKNELKFQLNSTIVFTELNKSEAVENKFEPFFDQFPTKILYKDELKKISLDRIFDNNIKAIKKSLIDAIRSAIFPEIKISKYREPIDMILIDEKISALDIEQERFAKSLPFGHYMITGIPGSGKSVALISRAIYLAKLFPKWKILILTYNKLLKHRLESQIESIKKDLDMLDININNIEVSNFHQKAMLLSDGISPNTYKGTAEEFWRDVLPKNAMKKAEPTYDAILIDEYQDFYKSWFRLVLKLIKEHKDDNKNMVKNLFLAGDRLQSIYNPKEINWKKDIGLDMRGRSKLLKTSYRITKEHISLGFYILRGDKRYNEEVDKFYGNGNNILLKNLADNSVEILEGDNLEIVKKFQEISKKYQYDEILLLAPTWKRINEIKRAFPIEIQKNIISSKKISENKAVFTTYHSAKGIEARVAIVVDVDRIIDRKLFYVASTRASSKLILHGINLKSSEIGKEIFKILKN